MHCRDTSDRVSGPGTSEIDGWEPNAYAVVGDTRYDSPSEAIRGTTVLKAESPTQQSRYEPSPFSEPMSNPCQIRKNDGRAKEEELDANPTHVAGSGWSREEPGGTAIVPAKMVTLRTQSICRYSESQTVNLCFHSHPIGLCWWVRLCQPRAYGLVRRRELFASLRLYSPVGSPRGLEAAALARVVKMGGEWRLFCGDEIYIEDMGSGCTGNESVSVSTTQ